VLLKMPRKPGGKSAEHQAVNQAETWLQKQVEARRAIDQSGARA
jgi:hypothetical protein